jgi:hypothetical protein
MTATGDRYGVTGDRSVTDIFANGHPKNRRDYWAASLWVTEGDRYLRRISIRDRAISIIPQDPHNRSPLSPGGA